MCVVTSIVAGTTAAVMGTLSAIGTAAAGVASAVTGVGAVAAGTGFMGTSIGLTGTGLAGIATAGSLAGAGAAATGTLAGVGSAVMGGVTGVGTALTTEAFAAGATAFGNSMSALGATGLGDALGANALAAGAETAAGGAMQATAALGAESGVAAAKGMAAVDSLLASGDAASAGGAADAGPKAGAGSTLLKEAAVAANGAGAVAESYGAYRQGVEDAKSLRAQARGAERSAESVIESAETEAKDLSRRQRQAVGRGRVAAAANGVMLEGRAESSPAMWEQDAEAEAAWDRAKLFANANTRANALYDQANQFRVSARNARRSGNLRAATSLVKGAALMAASQFGRPGTSLYA